MEWGMNGFVWNHRGRLGGSSGCALDSCTRRNATSLGCGVKWVQSHGESPLLLRNVLRRAFPILLGVPETGVMAGDPLGYRPRSQSLELGLCSSLRSHHALKQWEKSRPFREKWHPLYLKIIPFRNIISSSEADFIFFISFISVVFLLCFPLLCQHCFPWKSSSDWTVSHLHWQTLETVVQRSRINYCVAGWQLEFPAA